MPELLPAQNLRNPWIVIQGAGNKDWGAKKTQEYLQKVNAAKFVVAEKDWMPQFDESVASIEKSAALPSKDSAMADLPVFELGATAKGETLVVILSGDGGWSGLCRKLGEDLVNAGAPVIGFDLMRYLWRGGEPKELAQDLNRIMTHYLATWNKKAVTLVGYSLGADVLPFAASRLPE